MKADELLSKAPYRTRIDVTHNPRKAKIYMEWALKHLGNIRSVIDIGAGDGVAAEVLPCFTHYTGMDIGADIYARTKRVNYIKDIFKLCAKLNALKPADLVVLFDVLEHTNQFMDLLTDGFRKSSNFLFVSLPNEMNLERRVRFLFGQPVPAHGLCMLTANPGHKHQWLISYREAKTVLLKTASNAGFALTHEVFIRNLPKNPLKRFIVRLLSHPFPDDLVSHGLGFVFKKSNGTKK